MANSPSKEVKERLAADEPASLPAAVNPVEEPAQNAAPGWPDRGGDAGDSGCNTVLQTHTGTGTAAPAYAAGGSLANGHAAGAAKNAGRQP